VEFGCDNAFLAVQAHNSADETVLSILQNHFSTNELACLRDGIFAYDRARNKTPD
jgi:hypothetical protein